MGKRKIVLDTETTGLAVNAGDRVIEIGCVELLDFCVTGNSFHTYIYPEGQEISKGAIKVHGITLESLEGKPLFREIADKFCDFIRDDIIVAHNAIFDVRFLNFELKRARNRKLIQNENVIDTLKIARKMFPGSPASLDTLCKRFKISLAQRTVHGALLDAHLLARIYLELNNGSQSHLLFEKRNDEEQTEATNSHFPSREFCNSKNELSEHSKLIGKINSPIWNEYSDE